MRKSSVRILVVAVLLALGSSTAELFASGSYSGRPPKPPKSEARINPEPAAGTRIDQEKWELGKQVYNGDSFPLGGGDVDVQRPRLQALQAMLPPDVAKVKDLVGFAGAFSEAQLDALEYFVKRRFPAKKT